MKPLHLYLMLALSLLVACNNAKKESSEGNDYTVNAAINDSAEHPKITALKQFIDSCDSADVSSVSAVTAHFTQIFAGQTTGLCDTAYVVFQNFYDSVDVHINDSLQNDTLDYAAMMEAPKPSKQLKDFKKKLAANGFRLVNSSGAVYIEQDRSYVSKNFYPLLSDSMKVYLDEIKLESEQGFALDEQISITPDKLVNRVIWYEKFIAGNPKFLFLTNCKNFRKAYLTYLVNGYGKSVLYSDNATKELSAYFTEAYAYLLKTFPQSETAVLLQPYIDALLQKQTQKANEQRKTFVIKGLIYNLE